MVTFLGKFILYRVGVEGLKGFQSFKVSRFQGFTLTFDF